MDSLRYNISSEDPSTPPRCVPPSRSPLTSLGGGGAPTAAMKGFGIYTELLSRFVVLGATRFGGARYGVHQDVGCRAAGPAAFAYSLDDGPALNPVFV